MSLSRLNPSNTLENNLERYVGFVGFVLYMTIKEITWIRYHVFVSK